LILDPGWKNSDPGSNIPDPQHWTMQGQIANKSLLADQAVEKFPEAPLIITLELLLIGIRMDPLHFEKLDPDPHQS
jgi:hypothetical protein